MYVQINVYQMYVLGVVTSELQPVLPLIFTHLPDIFIFRDNPSM